MIERGEGPGSDAVPRRFLFASWEGGGNVPPLVQLAQELVARGHEVRVLGEPCHRGEFDGAGAAFESWRRAPHRHDRRPESEFLRDWEAKSPPHALQLLAERLIFGPAAAYAEDLREALSHRPDAIVVADMLFGAMAAAEASGIPSAIFAAHVYLYPAPGLPTFGPGFTPARGPLGRLRDALVRRLTERAFASHLPGFNALRARFGLGPVATPFEQVRRLDRFLVGTSRAFDYPCDALPSNVRHVGPRLDDPAWVEPWRSPWPADSREPLVLVGFSTTQQQQAGTLQKVVDALGALPVRGLVTLGPALETPGLQVPSNVEVCGSAPHAKLLPEAAAMVTHAGHGTTIRTLAAGVPLLCLPMGRDQNDTAARVAWHGAGLRLSPKASVRAIREALARLLAEPGFRERARALGAAVRAEAGSGLALRELEGLAAGEPRAAAASPASAASPVDAISGLRGSPAV